MRIQDHCGAVRAPNAKAPGLVVQTQTHWTPYGEPLSPKQQHGFSRSESSMSLSSSASAASLRIHSPPSISYGALESPEGRGNRGSEEDDNGLGLDRVARWLCSGSRVMFPSCSGYFWPDGDPHGAPASHSSMASLGSTPSTPRHRTSNSSAGHAQCSAAAQAVAGLDLRGQVAILTGGTSRMGREVASALCSAGVHVVMAVASLPRGRQVAAEIMQQNPSASLSVSECDLACFSSTRAFADQFLEMGLPLHVLINAAFHCSQQPRGGAAAATASGSAMKRAASQMHLSPDGYEMHFAVGYLGHFLLTELLLPKLQQTAFEEGGQTRIVNVCPFYSVPSSPGQKSSKQHQQHQHGAAAAEVRSDARNASLSLALYAAELSRRLASEDPGRLYCPLVTVNACTPAQTQAAVMDSRPGFCLEALSMMCMAPLSPDNAQPPSCRPDAAVSPVIIASDSNLRDISGRCFEGSSPTKSQWPGMHLTESARDLYDSSLHMVGLAVHGSPRHRVPLSP